MMALNNIKTTAAKNKLVLILFGTNLVVLAITYSVYLLSLHFSCDTYAALSPGELANVNISHGRFMHFLLYSALDAMGCDLPQHTRITQCLLTVVCSFGVSVVAKRFYDVLDSGRVAHLVLFDALTLLIIANPYFLSGWYYWPESCVGGSMGMLTSFLALIAWCSPNKTWLRRIASLILVVLAANMYQIYLEFFFGVALAYSLIEHAYKARLSTVLDLLCSVVWCGIAGASTVVSFNVLEKVFGVEMSRSFSEPVGLLTRLDTTLQAHSDIMFTGYGMFPKGLLIACIVFFIVASVIVLIRQKTILSGADLLLILIAFVAAYASSFAPEFATMNDPVPRIFVGVFALPLFTGSLFAFVSKESHFGSSIGGCAAVAFLCVFIACTLSIESDTIRCNAYDEAQLDVICKSLNEYEDSSGMVVDEILYGFDSSGNVLVPNVYPVFDVNKRSMRTPWFFPWAIKYRLSDKDQRIEANLMDTAKQKELFGDTDWDWFEPSEQIRFEGSTMYIVLY